MIDGWMEGVCDLCDASHMTSGGSNTKELVTEKSDKHQYKKGVIVLLISIRSVSEVSHYEGDAIPNS